MFIKIKVYFEFYDYIYLRRAFFNLEDTDWAFVLAQVINKVYKLLLTYESLRTKVVKNIGLLLINTFNDGV